MLLSFGSVTAASGPVATRAPFLLGFGFSLQFVTLVFVFAQVLVKWKRGKLGVDDALISVASIFALAVVILTGVACGYGFGLHITDIRPESILPMGKFIYTLIALSTVCFGLTKTAMLCFFLRFAVDSRFRIVCHLSIAFMALNSTAILLVNLFGCTPISGGWDRRQTNPSVCITTTPFYTYSSVNQLVLDIWLMVLPIKIVLGLRLGWLAKLGLMAMFSMGFLFVPPQVVVAFAIADEERSRIAAVSGVSLWKMMVTIDGADILWDGADSWLWTLAALNVGIMTTCMPGMKMFIQWIWGGDGVRAVAEDNTIGGGARGRRNSRAIKEMESGSRLGELAGLDEKREVKLDGGSSECMG